MDWDSTSGGAATGGSGVALQQLPDPEGEAGKKSVLLVSPFDEDVRFIRDCLPNDAPHLDTAENYTWAAQLLQANSFSVVLSERDLPDGGWRDVLNAVDLCRSTPLLIVASPYADERLWAEVLNLGGFDVLMKPFDFMETARVLAMARQHWASRNYGATSKGPQEHGPGW